MGDRLKFRAWNGGKMVYFGDGKVCTNYDDKFGMFFPLLSESFSMGSFDVINMVFMLISAVIVLVVFGLYVQVRWTL